MALPVPNLDDRKFQDLVEEARSMIPHYCPKWTDHNLSDPGITLIELFAWMVDLLLYRLNKVPEKNYIKFLDLIGVKLESPAAAKTDITFRLSAAQQKPVVIPKGTEVATVRTETEDAITFSTEDDLTIEVPTLARFLITHDITEDNAYFDDSTEKLKTLKPEEALEVFRKMPKVGNAFYLGYNEPLGGNILHIDLDFVKLEGVGGDPVHPPIEWEYWDSVVNNWVALDREHDDAIAWLEEDGTRGLQTKGDLVLHLPRSFGRTPINGKEAHWIRCRVTREYPAKGAYDQSPQIRAIASSAWGGTVPASHATTIIGEELGRSEGTPGQSFRLANSPVLELRGDEVVEVQKEDGDYEKWEKVPDFSQSEDKDKHFVLDNVEGEVEFGPAIRQPNGEIRHFGKIPTKDRLIRFSRYRYGGGSVGNVGRGTITVLKSSISYVESVTNRRGASEGSDAENVEHAKRRGPKTLRTRNRAVTAEDFEFLARGASPSVARAKCIQPREAQDGNQPPPGVVKVALVPALAATDDVILEHQLAITPELKETVEKHLDESRLLTTALIIDKAEYRWVKVAAKVKVKPNLDARAVRRNIESRLYRFLNPLYGGMEGIGWPFGRDLRDSDVHSCIQSVDGVDFVEKIELFHIVDPATGECHEPTKEVEVPPAGLICSHRHEIS